MPERVLARDYVPRAEVVTAETTVSRPRFPVVDAHNHLPVTDPRFQGQGLQQLVQVMDETGVETIVNLTGGTGPQLERTVAALDRAYPGRFVTFCNVDWTGVGESDWLQRRSDQLRADVQAGARGLKVFKELGLRYRDTRGQLVLPDDERIAGIWATAGELGIPVLIHTGDPAAFFTPLDRANERRSALLRRPEWYFYSAEFPTFRQLLDALYRTIEAHPETTFITAHVGCHPENLAFVSAMLERYPNLYTDISARFGELGRVPYSARRWFLDYPDRILFGTDGTPTVGLYRNAYRFMETRDEYFDWQPDPAVPPSRIWKLYGVYLPDEVLRRVYRDNAARLLGLNGGA